MGRVASAQTGQRTSQLVVAVMNDKSAALTHQSMRAVSVHPSKAAWIAQRRERMGKEQAVAAVMQLFQDDLLEVAVGSDMEYIIERVDSEVLQGELQVGLGAKSEANLPFSGRFDFIGASFGTSDLGSIKCRPADLIIARLREQLAPFLEVGAGLMELGKVQELIGRLAFCARFVAHGRTRLNSAYSCLAASEHIRLRRRQVMISQEMMTDLRGLWDDVTKGRRSPITVSSTFQVPVQQGASSDASGSLANGWGLTRSDPMRTGYGLHERGGSWNSGACPSTR